VQALKIRLTKTNNPKNFFMNTPHPDAILWR
jgi:hypothetical protein